MQGDGIQAHSNAGRRYSRNAGDGIHVHSNAGRRYSVMQETVFTYIVMQGDGIHVMPGDGIHVMQGDGIHVMQGDGIQ